VPLEKEIVQTKTYVISDPNNELWKIYSCSTLVEIIGLRAELDYSIENRDKIPDTEKQLFRQNPKYTEIVETIKNLYGKKGGKYSDFVKLHELINKFLKLIGEEEINNEYIYTGKHLIDVRETETTKDCMNAIMCKVINSAEKQKPEDYEKLGWPLPIIVN